jgi:hypothetical protein
VDALLTSLALALPILLGGLWISLLVPPETTARNTLVWGSGTLLGLLLIPQFMWGLDTLGLPLSFWAPASLTFALIVVAVVAGLLRKTQRYATQSEMRALFAMPLSHKALFLFLLLLLGLRLTTLGLEVLWRPLFPWDATMHWATKAKVWFEFKSMVPFVDNASWLNLGGENVFTDRHPNYPPTIPLLQVWMNLAIGRWDESLMNLPWLLCLIALGAAFYSQLRNVGVRPAISISFTYLLLSMPLINTHVALAGYADLFLGAAYCSALMAFHNWQSTKQRWQALLMVIFVITCPLIKNEGYVWSLTLVPALIFANDSWRTATKLGALSFLVVLLLTVVMLFQPAYIDQALGLTTGFDMKALLGIIKSVWLHDNWHLFSYLFLVSILLGLTLPTAVTRTYRGIASALASAVAIFLFLFLFTVFSQGASNFTGVGRLSIQLVPSLLYITALLCNEVLTRGRRRSAPESSSASQQS